jgi:hypothetical protein
MTKRRVRRDRWRLLAAALLTTAFATGCLGEEPATGASSSALRGLPGRVSLPTHHTDDGSCGAGSHMCCDSVGQFECLTDSPVGPDLCPPGFDQPCDGAGPPPSQCGPGNHACCDASGQVQCLVDAPPGMQNLCPPLTDAC